MATQDFAERPGSGSLEQARAELLHSVDRFRRRIRTAGTARMIPRAAAVALWAALAGELFGVRFDSTAARSGIIAVGVVIGVALLSHSFMRRPSALSAALEFDLRLGLKERLSTAVELADSPGKFLLLPSQIADAARRAAAIEPSQAYRLPLPRLDMLAALVGALLLAAWHFMPSQAGLRASVTSMLEPPIGRTDETFGGELSADGTIPIEPATDQLERSTRDRMRDSLEQLQRISNPEAQALRQRLADAAESLMETRVARDAGRRLSGEDYPGAAEALRELSESLDKLNSAERQELIEGLQDAAAATSEDQLLSSQFSDAARSLENYQDRSAAESIQQIAQRIEEAEAMLESEQVLQSRIEQLQRALGIGGTKPTGQESGGQTNQAKGSSGGEDGADEDGQGTGLTSGAQGRELGDLEDMGAETRLDALGNLEVVELEAGQEAPTESFERPQLQLGRKMDVSLNPSAGEMGAVRARRDSNNQIPLDAMPWISRYFSPPEGQ